MLSMYLESDTWYCVTCFLLVYWSDKLPPACIIIWIFNGWLFFIFTCSETIWGEVVNGTAAWWTVWKISTWAVLRSSSNLVSAYKFFFYFYSNSLFCTGRNSRIDKWFSCSCCLLRIYVWNSVARAAFILYLALMNVLFYVLHYRY